MPVILAQTLAIAHGGQRGDYDISEATVAPYLISCRSSQLRDAVVQRGVYTNLQAQVQFSVHEWRPRFGMRYDPPGHQVWVKLVGLPLQAWTTPEITAFIQRFGHPMQIMPFGRAAGHYKDVTALVAVKDPSLIPLAYMYREGDFTTQVDIYISSSRLWDDSFFPPPEDSAPRRNHTTHPSNHRTPTNHHHNSISPSSSNGVLSEPTIDLSAWSPRSCQATVLPQQPIESNRPLEVGDGQYRGAQSYEQGKLMLILPPRPGVPFDALQNVSQGRNLPHATVNPTVCLESSHIPMLLLTHRAPTASPLIINPSCTLRTVNNLNINILSDLPPQNLLAIRHSQNCSDQNKFQRGERRGSEMATLEFSVSANNLTL